MQKTETKENASTYGGFHSKNERFIDDFDQFDSDCTTMSIYENLIGISEQCPIRLNNTLTQAFALLQEKCPSENHIKTLATFTEMLLILSTYDDFIHREYDRFYNAYEAYQKFSDIRHGRR